ncbi:hypothetical protein KC957_01215 [Candidatus Saccharibacteria bacterium]|nr:hypothetical protein [Candidatus Saccharibacteria bacterium]
MSLPLPAGTIEAGPRPVEVTYVPEATFADILDMGVAELAVRDATVIERITEPGYEDFIGRMGELGRTSIWRVPKSYIDDQRLVLSPQARVVTSEQPQHQHVICDADVEADEFYQKVDAFYRALRKRPETAWTPLS